MFRILLHVFHSPYSLKLSLIREVLAFLSGLAEDFFLLEYNAALIGYQIQTIRGYIMVSSS